VGLGRKIPWQEDLKTEKWEGGKANKQNDRKAKREIAKSWLAKA
jgi:hypothetical protein